MLIKIKINSFAIIPNLAIDLKQGLTVITGQTGSGKSIVFEAIKFALGERIAQRENIILPHADTCSVELTFSLMRNMWARSWLKDNGFELTDTLVICRTVSKKKSSVLTINGRSVTLGVLQNLGKHLVHIHGQNTHLAAASSHFQKLCIDVVGQAEKLVEQANQLYKSWSVNQEQITQLVGEQPSASEQELLGHYLSELEQLAPLESDWQYINQTLRNAANIDQTAASFQEVLEILKASSVGVTSALNKAVDRLEHLPKGISPAENAGQCLKEALVLCQEAEHEIEQNLTFGESEPMKVAELEKRIQRYFELARKHQIKPQELEKKHQELLVQHQACLEYHQKLAKLNMTLKQQQEQWLEVARALTKIRVKTAEEIAPKIGKAMKSLGMPHARVHVQITENQQYPRSGGLDQICFLVSTNPDHPLKPLDQIASGGELSRISLIMRQMMTVDGEAITLVFDEAEAGISGSVATKVGCLLRSLSSDGQVLCITHVPQVAALGDIHYRVEKRVEQGRTHSSFLQLNTESRVDELARMIGHEELTETAKMQAKELLKERSLTEV